MAFPKYVQEAVRDAITVPPHIAAAAQAVRYDLLHGPSFALIPAAGIEGFTADCFATFADDLDASQGLITEACAGPVAEALRAFIDGLPTLYVDDYGLASEYEPEGYYDGDGEWIKPEPHYQVEPREAAGLLFGDTIGRHFA